MTAGRGKAWCVCVCVYVNECGFFQSCRLKCTEGLGLRLWFGLSLSNKLVDKRIQLVFIFNPYELVDNVTAAHGYHRGNRRHLEQWEIGEDEITINSNEWMGSSRDTCNFIVIMISFHDSFPIHLSVCVLYWTSIQNLQVCVCELVLTPYSIARSVWSSMSTLAMATRPFCLATAFSSLGPRILQGPHHLDHTHTHRGYMCVLPKNHFLDKHKPPIKKYQIRVCLSFHLIELRLLDTMCEFR